MKRFLERTLQLRPGELGPGLLLFLYLFLIISAYVVGKVARSALFLGKFRAETLPYVILLIAVLTGFVVVGYVWLGKRIGVRNLVVSSLLFFSLTAVTFWLIGHFAEAKANWLFPAIYVWVGIYGVLAPAQVWTLANYVLTTREAKRLFGVIGGGAIAGWIFGGFFSKTVQQAFGKRYGAEILLLVMALFLAICAVLVVFIWRRRRAHTAAEAKDTDFVAQSVASSLKLVWSSPYLQAISTVICLSSVATTIAGWQLDATAQKALVTEEKLGVFFADFNFYAALVALATQLLLTSRVLRRFGIGPALFVVPVFLIFGEGGVLIWGTLMAAVVLKGGDQILRYSIDKSTVELLYLPVAPNIKLQVKSFIDTAIWRFGDGMAALAVLVFATTLNWSAVQVGWVNLVFLLGWVGAALVARRHYVLTLRESIQQHRLDAERAAAPVLDRSTAEIFAGNLSAADPQEILYALSLFEIGQQRASHPAVRLLLKHPAPEVRRRALAVLTAAGDGAVVADAERLLTDPDIAVRTEALLYLSRVTHLDPLVRLQELGDFPDFSIRSGMVLFYSKPGPAHDLETASLLLDGMVNEAGPAGKAARLEAARLISVLPGQFDAQLFKLLSDPDPEVLREAIRAVGGLGKRHLVPLLLDRLSDLQLEAEVSDVLAKFGDRVVGTLRDHMVDPNVSIEVRRVLPGILQRIGTAEAGRALAENLLESDTTLRFRIISALNKLRLQHPQLDVDDRLVESILAAEILGHYRSYQIIGVMGGDVNSKDPVVVALVEAMRQEVERIFRLLGLLYPRHDFHSAYVGLQSTDAIVHANALEFLDNVLHPPLRQMLVPLLDGEVSVAERVQLAERMVGIKMESREEAIAVLVRSDDPWLKSCGAYAIGSLGLKSLEAALDACLEHPDALLRETARHAKSRLAELAGTTPA
jgi:AAA family ATP:ADP antiporter